MTESHAFGWPGIEPRWTSSAKTGVGTALATVSRVWFTISHGIFNEIYYPHLDEAILFFSDCPEEHCKAFPNNRKNLHLCLSEGRGRIGRTTESLTVPAASKLAFYPHPFSGGDRTGIDDLCFVDPHL